MVRELVRVRVQWRQADRGMLGGRPDRVEKVIEAYVCVGGSRWSGRRLGCVH